MRPILQAAQLSRRRAASRVGRSARAAGGLNRDLFTVSLSAADACTVNGLDRDSVSLSAAAACTVSPSHWQVFPRHWLVSQDSDVTVTQVGNLKFLQTPSRRRTRMLLKSRVEPQAKTFNHPAAPRGVTKQFCPNHKGRRQANLKAIQVGPSACIQLAFSVTARALGRCLARWPSPS